MGWIGVDFDGTIAEFEGVARVGKPIDRMVMRVKSWFEQGREVRIFTARVSELDNPEFTNNQRRMIQEWCKKYLGQELAITAQKDFQLDEIWDDKAMGVIPNTGLSFYEELN